MPVTHEQDGYRLPWVVDFEYHAVVVSAYSPAFASSLVFYRLEVRVIGETSDCLFCIR